MSALVPTCTQADLSRDVYNSAMVTASASRYRPLPQPPVPGRALNRLLNKRLGINQRVVHALLRRAKRLAMPRALRRAQQLPAQPVDTDWRLDHRQGYHRFDATRLPNWSQVVDTCQQLFDAYRDREISAGNPRKAFLHTLADADTLVRCPELLEFMLHRPLLDAARISERRPTTGRRGTVVDPTQRYRHPQSVVALGRGRS